MRYTGKLLAAAALAALLRAASVQAEPATRPPPPALTLMSAAVACSDLQKSIDFYTRGLGLKAVARLENPKSSEVVLAFPGGGANLLLLKSKDAAEPAPPRTALNRIVLTTPDLKALQARLEAAGYRLSGPLHEEARFHVTVANVEDPDGDVIEVVQHGP